MSMQFINFISGETVGQPERFHSDQPHLADLNSSLNSSNLISGYGEACPEVAQNQPEVVRDEPPGWSLPEGGVDHTIIR